MTGPGIPQRRRPQVENECRNDWNVKPSTPMAIPAATSLWVGFWPLPPDVQGLDRSDAGTTHCDRDRHRQAQRIVASSRQMGTTRSAASVFQSLARHHSDDPDGQVEVNPLKPEQLVTTQPGIGGQGERHKQAVAVPGFGLALEVAEGAGQVRERVKGLAPARAFPRPDATPFWPSVEVLFLDRIIDRARDK